jgi:hypothetical protein
MLSGMCVCTYDRPDTSCPIFSNSKGSTVEAEALVRMESRTVIRIRVVEVVVVVVPGLSRILAGSLRDPVGLSSVRRGREAPLPF